MVSIVFFNRSIVSWGVSPILGLMGVATITELDLVETPEEDDILFEEIIEGDEEAIAARAIVDD